MALRFESTTIRNGVVGSLAGGAVFGMMMTMMDMMPMVAMLVRSESVVVGWLVHLVISAIFGVVFGALLANVAVSRFLLGMGWGVAAWVGGALVLMPLFLGMPKMVLNLSGSTPWFSLVGHVAYGFVAGGVALWLEKREEPARAPATRVRAARA